jgi:hypothetical protein
MTANIKPKSLLRSPAFLISLFSGCIAVLLAIAPTAKKMAIRNAPPEQQKNVSDVFEMLSTGLNSITAGGILLGIKKFYDENDRYYTPPNLPGRNIEHVLEQQRIIESGGSEPEIDEIEEQDIVDLAKLNFPPPEVDENH